MASPRKNYRDFPHNAGDLILDKFPGPGNKLLRAQILREMNARGLLGQPISLRQLSALHDAAEESMAKRSPKAPPKRPPVWRSSRRGRGYPRR